MAPNKLTAEGRPAEVQIVFGWSLHVRRLLVLLPEDKLRAWSQDLAGVLEKGDMTVTVLESLIVSLNHASHLVPLSRHFLNHPRERIKDKSRSSRQSFRLSREEVEDLKLWKVFLEKAVTGISMNLLTLRIPNLVAFSDSCPFGIGGHTLKGWAWRV